MITPRLWGICWYNIKIQSAVSANSVGKKLQNTTSCCKERGSVLSTAAERDVRPIFTSRVLVWSVRSLSRWSRNRNCKPVNRFVRVAWGDLFRCLQQWFSTGGSGHKSGLQAAFCDSTTLYNNSSDYMNMLWVVLEFPSSTKVLKTSSVLRGVQ